MYSWVQKRGKTPVRVRTDEKRHEILKAARAVIEEVGSHRASMTAIAARLGGSKATLYGYFATKERLLAAAMVDAVEARGLDLLTILNSQDTDAGRVLTAFGAAYLPFVTSAEITSLSRTAIAEAATSEFGRELYALGPQRVWAAVSAYLAGQMAEGKLRRAAPDLAAFQFKGLIEAGILEPRLFGVEPRFDPKEVVADAVAVFMASYGVPTGGADEP
ncbi:TetR/AcrR family transcriptional regulator [Xanthobacteraceae bacterium Astr-EGSB]|uniref:TetR/AcrR family transcriptional regulator n=1 Tax=Astrobacterium formosum TaxID=3069710 RepID=UPI0027B4A3DF|nr:TetR/AcrR family transcriptional regulator [Xanthobacteraceae bacterium Astr-EGSB]